MRTDYSMFEYKNGWYGNILDPVSNKNIIVHISSSDSKQIPDECKEALDWFVENYEAMHDELLYKILEYYCDERENLGYDVEENEDYPFVSSIDEISNMITFRAITIPNQQRFIKGVFLVYDCSWDIEEGLGIRIVDGQIIRVGNQGIALWLYVTGDPEYINANMLNNTFTEEQQKQIREKLYTDKYDNFIFSTQEGNVTSLEAGAIVTIKTVVPTDSAYGYEAILNNGKLESITFNDGTVYNF